MDTKAAGRGSAGEPYYYRRSLEARDYAVAAGVGVGIAALGFYVVSRMLQRTPLVPDQPLGPVIPDPAPIDRSHPALPHSERPRKSPRQG
jgi:hypothetical protein